MPSAEARRVLSKLFAERGKPQRPLDQVRREWETQAESDPLPEGTEVTDVRFGDVAAEWVRHPKSSGNRVFLFIHGGGFSAGSPVTHRKFAAHLSEVTGARVLVPDYRLAPEHPFPAGVQDCITVYGALLKSGVRASEIAIGGDSAGGGMAVSALIALRDAKAPMPACAVLVAPWLDLTNSSPTYTTNAAADPTISHARHQIAAAWYIGDADPANPVISPLYAELDALPPTLVQVGAIEVMLDDSRIFAERAAAVGTDVTLEVWPDLWHVWHQYVPEVPEAVVAFTKIGDFVKKHLA